MNYNSDVILFLPEVSEKEGVVKENIWMLW